jgi:HEAT repeat protein
LAALFLAVAPLLGMALPWVQAGDELEKRLADSDERKRRSAVEELGRQNGVEALGLLLRALRDPSPMVADEAQLALRSVDEEAEFALLFSKDGLGSKSELVRLRCAEALGRIDARPPMARLVKLLADKDPAVRRALAASIEKLAARGELVEEPGGPLRKALDSMCERDNTPGVRAAALMALNALAPRLDAARLTSFAGDKAYEVRSAALLAARELAADKRLSLARDGLGDAHSGVRLQSLKLLAVDPNRDGAQLLAQSLENQQTPRVADAPPAP